MSEDLFPRCPKCGDYWHGMRCLRAGCTCLSAWDDNESNGETT